MKINERKCQNNLILYFVYYDHMKYTVIAPAYNEEGNVEPLVRRICEVMDKIGVETEILIVDDGSTDLTFARLKQLTGEFPSLTVISLEENRGQTVAYQAGFDFATGERIVTMDADLEKDPAFIPEMIEKLDGQQLDIVYFRKLYKDVPLIRKLASRAANIFRRAVTGDKAVDVGSTFILYRWNIFKGRNFASGFHRFFIGFMETEGLSMGYIEGPVYKRAHGETKYTTLGRLKQGLLDLFYFYLYKNRKIGLYKIIFALSAFFIISLFIPAGAQVRTAVNIFMLAALASLGAGIVHVSHLLVQSGRLPYKIREIWPPRS